MTKKEKNRVLLALVSEMRYFNEEIKKTTGNYHGGLTGYIKENHDLFLKLVNVFFKNDEKMKESYRQYLNDILKEII